MENYRNLGYEELLEAKQHIDGLIEERREEVRQQFRNETMEKAKKLGIDPLSVLCSIEAKYRDPANPQNTWGGKGRKPGWLQAYIDKGHDKEQYAV